MINRQELLKDLQRLLRQLEADLRERCKVADIGAAVKAEYEKAKKAKRTAQSFEDWRTDYMTQIGAAWILSCVFARFLEDNQLVDPPKLSGPTGAGLAVSGQQSAVSQTEADSRSLNADSSLQRARDEYDLYVHDHPADTVREYLLFVFDGLAKLPGGKDIFGKHNLVHEQRGWISGDAAKELRNFWQRIDPASGKLIHDFTDSDWDTRFLGDLYQDLSEAARKKYALLQTPEFVEEFILDRTLEPALDEFGLVVSCQSSVVSRKNTTDHGQLTTDLFRMIDPACGSGHFLLGAFPRILKRWQKKEPGTNVRELVQRTLHSIHGVDINPFAIAIARFRLLLAALRASDVHRLADAPAFHMNLACGDSLYHGRQRQQTLGDWTDESHYFRTEDAENLRRILQEGTFHAVVANPPYIVPKDRAANQAYRRLYPKSCHMKYSLAVPFMERLFRLAVVSGQSSVVSREKTTDNCQLTTDNSLAAGYVGQITANSFMKREFGKKLIESFFPTVDLTHVIDTSGVAFCNEGFGGTPTVILFGRHRPAVASMLRTVMGIRGEPATPDDPARGLVWSAILAQVDQPGSQSEFVSVGDSPREMFHKHPWSIGGGGASELKESLEDGATQRLESLADSIGITSFTLEDDVFILPEDAAHRWGMTGSQVRPMVVGDVVRDWTRGECDVAVFPYDESFQPIVEPRPSGSGLASPFPDGRGSKTDARLRYLWIARTCLANNKMFGGKTKVECGMKWFEYGRLTADKLRTPLSIVFAFVATHNHFVLDRGGKVFNRTAPVIKLPPEASEDEHLTVLGLLNSSTACFWIKQVSHDLGGGGGASKRGSDLFENFWEHTGTKLLDFPLPADRPLITARSLDSLATRASDFQPASIASCGAPTRAALDTAKSAAQLARSQMIAAQEELDWECYRLYGLLSDQQSAVSGQPEEKEAESCLLTADSFPPLQLGQRAFEIVLARQLAAGETQTTWFERHGSTPITELPAEWPDDYRQLVERRIALIASDPNIRLIEQPEYKRRWNTEPWDSQLERALREWLLDRLESYFDFDGRMREVVSCQSSVVSGEEEATRSARVSDPAATADRRSPEVAEPVGDSGDLRSVDCAGSGDPRTARPGANGLNPSGIKPLDIALVSVAKLSDVARQDAEFMDVAALYRDRPDFDILRLVTDLVTAESVPLLPVLRYKADAMDKRQAWERTWELQREEDQRSAVSGQQSAGEERLTADGLTADSFSIPVPPKYKSSDFQSSTYWRLRGKLDVPKERWVSLPHCEGEDQSLVIAWAGYDHLQLTKAVSTFFAEVQQTGGSEDPRLVPLLGCILELNPWVKQWNNDVDPDFGYPLGDYFANFVEDEARTLGKTVDDIRAWQPPAKKSQKKKRTKKKAKSAND